MTLVSGKHRRLTLIECNNDVTAMIDIAKVADLVSDITFILLQYQVDRCVESTFIKNS